MALSRRTGNRLQASIWPGFVDAMTALLLVLMFVLTIFMVVQFVLRETITGQESELDQLTEQIMSLADALGLEQNRARELQSEVTRLGASLEGAQNTAEVQAALIATLQSQTAFQTEELAAERARITSFEAQVATLLAERDNALERGDVLSVAVEELEAARAELISDQEALQLALARARDEIDVQVETARLAAARREALDALIADMRQRNAEAGQKNTDLQAQLETAQSELSDAERLRLTEAAAAEALRERLQNADSELTAMTLALEEQRKKAEDTLTLLAAAQAAREDLSVRLAAALTTGQEATEARDAFQTQLAAALLAKNNTEENLAVAEQALEAMIAEVAALGDVAATKEEIEAQLVAALAAQMAAEQAAERAFASADERDAVLAEALAAKLAAEEREAEALTSAEEHALLLQTANRELEKQEAQSAESQRRMALLSEQVAALRSQLGSLQAILDEAAAKDVAANVQIEALGSQLNTALAQVAAEERRRRELEEAERKRLEERALDLERYRSEFFGQLRDVLGEQEGVRIEGDRFVFSSEVLFAPGAVDLSEEGRGEIAKVARILQEVVDDIPPQLDWVIRVDGHTDDVPLISTGKYQDNWELSQGRALSVVRYMIEELGIQPDRLAAAGFGQFHPINPEPTREARAQNRRIELKFTEK
ncbi:peptidoglycan -binding protein [Pseudohalocynthiibacter aestuariivivens]|uniref:Peptidoglycan -binding protein n=1 Tax=Pseudohalocynthiibacter aestuariivivens TaxID=1591409 RepID=A0ABV5JCV5_9RHOB|nr:peptidoglycan -binding protein [Pseudohalocynthiibacter aestuariivivens]MBS9717219.1 peptidoglycan -binding protein [Pseudohalocynthiibacter aestuariivivens]